MLLNYYILEPFKKRNVALAILRLTQLFSERSNGYTDLIIRQFCRVVKPKIPLSLKKRPGNEDVGIINNKLKADGFCIIPSGLSLHDLENLNSYLFDRPVWINELDSFTINPLNMPTQYPRLTWNVRDLVTNDNIQKLVIASNLAVIAQEYLGARPFLSSISAWIDPNYNHEYSGHVYHYDNDGPAFIKFFIYLNDISDVNGPHRFIIGSHSPVKPRKFSASRRYSNDEILNFYGVEREVVFMGPAGMVIAEDTRGFHRGSPVINGYRMLLEIQFSILDIVGVHDLSNFEPVESSYLMDDELPIYRKFFKSR